MHLRGGQIMKIQNCRIIKSKVDMKSSGHSNVSIKFDLGRNIIKKHNFTSALEIDINQLKHLMKFANVLAVSQLENCVVKVVLDDYDNLLGFGNPLNDEYFLLDYHLSSLYNEEELKKIFK